MNVVIGTPICRRGAYAMDKFLANQEEIQRKYESSELVLATSEADFIEELRGLIDSTTLRATVVHHQVVKPDHAISNLWDIAGGRDAIRRHTLSQTPAAYLFFMDADMTFDASVIEIMEREIQGHGAVFSGYPLRDHGVGLAGAGCVMLTRGVLERLRFRCYEFKNGETIFEDNVLEMDLFRMGARAKRGFFVSITHHTSPTESRSITPRPLGFARRVANAAWVRYVLIRGSIMVQRNIPWKLKVLLDRSASA